MKTFHIKTWGCQMNLCDSDDIKRILKGQGMVDVHKIEDADLIILNTCSVRQKAEDKVSGVGRKIIDIKKNKPFVKVIMTGCMVQRIDRRSNMLDSKYGRKMKRRFDWVDDFFPIGGGEEWKNITGNKKNINKKIALQSEVISYVPITIGCNNFCTYCVVPYTRGQEISVKYRAIEDRIDRLVNSGSKIVILLGQNVNSWMGYINRRSADFSDLLDNISKKYPSIWFSFLTSHPKDFSTKLIEVLKKNNNICHYLNLPFQSGSNRILKKMNRQYTRSDYLHKINKLKQEIPDIRLSTDIIVGFPGESESDFMKTVDLVKKVNFAMAYISEYSNRPGTPGSMLSDSVSTDTKKKRKMFIDKMVVQNSTKYNRNYLGKVVEVIITGENMGKTFELVDVRVDKGKIGSNCNVKITSTSECGLVGRVVV